MIKIAVIDDQPLLRQGLSMIISEEKDMTVIWTAENGNEGIAKYKIDPPDIILMDIRMPALDGIETTMYIRQLSKEVKIIILTTFDEDHYVFDALKQGANGYLLKDAEAEIIVKSLRQVYSGGSVISPPIATKVLQYFSDQDTREIDGKELLKLSERELQVTELISQGYNNREIAKKLFLSEGTIKNLLSKILEKLELRDRTQLAIYYIKSDKKSL